MNIGLELIEANLLVSIEMIILMISALGCLIFYAYNFNFGNVMLFIAGALNFMLSYALGWNYAPALAMMFIGLILMTFGLYATNKATSAGGII